MVIIAKAIAIGENRSIANAMLPIVITEKAKPIDKLVPFDKYTEIRS